jgi:hypothetical protein
MGIIEQLGGLEAIREKVACPELGDKYYGEWGSLPLKARVVIHELVERYESLDKEYRKLCEEKQERA